MSTISTAYDKIVTEMTTLYPSHRRLTNPYQVEQNVEKFLEQGWGISVQAGLNTERQLSCRLSVQRTVNLILSRKFFARELNVESKADTEKLILEDHFSLLENFEKDHTLDGTVTNFKYVSDSGIEFVFAEKNQYLVLTSVYEMEYFETIV